MTASLKSRIPPHSTEQSTQYTLHRGARLAYRVQGRGPALLMIAGAGGNGNRHDALAQRLSPYFTVISYDRRCQSGSSGDMTLPFDLEVQAEDAIAILAAAQVKQAYVFANSGGAVIALRLIERYPTHVLGLLAHEPPAAAVLPDAQRWIQLSDEVQQRYLDEGLADAMTLFKSHMVGMPARARASGQNQGEGQGESTVGNSDSQVNLAYFLTQEITHICRYRPDVSALRRSRVPMVFMAGHASGDAYYARPARYLAKALDCPFEVVEGHHISFITDPDVFADALLKIFQKYF
ncbi:MAG: alpha/beta fold hydrolase [Pontibacterium sp.]